MKPLARLFAAFAASFAITTALSSLADDVPSAEIRIQKSTHTLKLVRPGLPDKTYQVALGPGGAGPKRMEGDKVTPVGRYRVTGRIPHLFHHFLVLDYPNAEDRARYAELKARGEIPAGVGVGNGIGIHGVGVPGAAGTHKQTDWTLGCIALDDDEIDELSRSIRVGTPVVITD